MMSKEKEKTEKIELTPFERLVIIGMLPQRSSRHKGVLIKQIDETLALTDEEIVKYEVTYHAQGTSFDSEKSEGDPFKDLKEFEFPKEKMKIIAGALKEADREERLPVDEKVHELYDKIVE